MRKNNYPLSKSKRIVLYNSYKRHLEPVPKIGKKYHCFDDGKIRFSRHFVIQVDEVLGHQQFRKKYPKEFKLYREAIKSCYWLYSKHSDRFIITYKGENEELGVYVRTKQGGWFGIGELWNSATLDSTGELWNNLIKRIDDFNYTNEEKEQLLKDKTI